MRFSVALAVASCFVVGSHAATDSVPHDALLTHWQAEAETAVSKLTTELDENLASLNAAHKESFDKTTALMEEVTDLRAMIVLCDFDYSMQQEKQQYQDQLDSKHILIENEAQIMKTNMDKINEILKIFESTRFETFKKIFDKARLEFERDRPNEIQSFNRALHDYTRESNIDLSCTAKSLTFARSSMFVIDQSFKYFDLSAQKKLSKCILSSKGSSEYSERILSARDQFKKKLRATRQMYIDELNAYYIAEAKYNADVEFLHYLIDCLPENVRYAPSFD